MSIRFKPWIGPDYETGGVLGLRVLVLGESHYAPPGDDGPEFTRDVVRCWAFEGRNRFLTVTAKLVLPEPVPYWLSDARKHAFYNSVAFYSYVQRFPGEHARIRPTADMWAEAPPAFRTVLGMLRPQAVVVLGKENWWHLPPGDAEPPVLSAADPTTPLRVFSTGKGTTALAGMTQHPSSWRFRLGEWQPRVQALLRAAAESSHPGPSQEAG